MQVDGPPLTNKDWLAKHQLDWQGASANLTGARLREFSGLRGNTFIKAAFFNTKHYHPAEYSTLRERHDYYDLLSFIIEYNKEKAHPDKIRDIKFFHATTFVTGSPGTATAETIAGLIDLEKKTREAIISTNKLLFEYNMKILRFLLFVWKEPRSPLTKDAVHLNPFQFDIHMVYFEQHLVESILAKLGSRERTKVAAEISKLFDLEKSSWITNLINPLRTPIEHANQVLGQTMDFNLVSHRRTLGFALLHILHRKSVDDLRKFIGDLPNFVRSTAIPKLFQTKDDLS